MIPRRGTKEGYLKRFEPGEREMIAEILEKERLKRKRLAEEDLKYRDLIKNGKNRLN